MTWVIRQAWLPTGLQQKMRRRLKAYLEECVRQDTLVAAISTPEGRSALAATMLEPFRSARAVSPKLDLEKELKSFQLIAKA